MPPVPSRHRARTRADAAAPFLGILKALAVLTVVAVVSAGSLGAIAAWRIGSTIENNEIDISNGAEVPDVPAIGAISGAFNMLLVGADNEQGQESFGEEREVTLNDVNILVHVSADHSSATVVSFPRDLVIPGPECTDPETGDSYSAVSAQALNTSFARGGLGCVVATVSELTGLEIPYAALFSFAGTVAMTDAIGGVPICVTDEIDDPRAGLSLPAGITNVTGRDALAFLRSRHGVGDGSDLSRIASQQQYMASAFRTMTSAGTLGNPAKLYGLATAAAENVKLSESLSSIDRMVAMAMALKDVDASNIAFVQYPNGADAYNPNKVVPNRALAEQLMTQLAADLPIRLDEDALGDAAELDPNAAPAPEAPVAEVPVETGGTESAAPVDPAEPTVTEGLRGQTGDQATCAVANN